MVLYCDCFVCSYTFSIVFLTKFRFLYFFSCFYWESMPFLRADIKMSIPSHRKFSSDLSVLTMRNTMRILEFEIQNVVAIKKPIPDSKSNPDIQTGVFKRNPFKKYHNRVLTADGIISIVPCFFVQIL